MKPNSTPSVPPALRKAKAGDISSAFPPIMRKVKPEPLPATETPASAPAVVEAGSTVAPKQPEKLPASLPSVVAGSSTSKSITTRPKPVVTGRSPVAQLEGREVIFEGTFRIAGGEQFVVETKLTGNGARDKASVIALARKRHPSGPMNLISTRIFTRSSGSAPSFPKGATLGQLFGPAGSDTEAGIEIGSAFWQGERSQIVLVNLRSRNAVVINLRSPSGGRVSFSNQIAANTPAENLKSVVKEVLGQDVRELNITLKQEEKV